MKDKYLIYNDDLTEIDIVKSMDDVRHDVRADNFIQLNSNLQNQLKKAIKKMEKEKL